MSTRERRPAWLRRRSAGLQALALLLPSLLLAAATSAQIATDGTLGPQVSFSEPDVEIPASLGQFHGDAAGGNLFHSFLDFNIPSLGSATFVPSATDSRGIPLGPIRNLIARVTGGSPSSLDGRLTSLLGEQSFYLLNPAGVMFGPGARLELPGAFHATTAASLEFPGGQLFEASLTGSVPQLATSDPVAFGFLGDLDALIRLEGASIQLADEFSLRSGSLEIADAELAANRVVLEGLAIHLDLDSEISTIGPNSSIDILGGDIVLRGTVVTFRTLGDSDLDGGPISIVGDSIEISRDESLDLEGGHLQIETGSNSGGDAGPLYVAGDVILLRNAVLSARSFEAEPGVFGDSGDITIEAGSLRMQRSQIIASGSGAGRAGSIILDVSDGPLEMLGTSEIFASKDDGGGGDIYIAAPSVLMDDKSLVQTSTFGTGDAGSITFEVGSLRMQRGALINASTANLTNGGDAGPISVRATDFVEIVGEGEISANLIEALLTQEGSSAGVFALTAGAGNGGSVHIKAPRISIRNAGTVAAIGAGGLFGLPGGDAGSIVLEGDTIEVLDGGLVDSGSVFRGRGGSVALLADSVVVIRGATAGGVPSRVRSFNAGGGSQADPAGENSGGDILVSAPRVDLSEGGAISTSTLDLGAELGILGLIESRGAGAGEIRIEAGVVQVSSGGRIESSSFSGGQAGRIDVTATDAIQLEGGAIEAQTSDQLGASEAIYKDLVDGGFTLLERSSSGDAGALTLNAPRISLRNGATVATRSNGAGSAGQIELNLNELELSSSQITAAAEESFGGSISVNGGELVRLPNGELTAVVRPDQRPASRVQLKDSLISTSVGVGTGNGGNVLVNSDVIVLDNDPETGTPAIGARAEGGDGGNILLATDFAFASWGDVNRFLDASSETGVDGVAVVASPQTNVIAGVNPLDTHFQDPSQRMAASCAARATDSGGSFRVAQREASTDSSDALLLAFEAGLGVSAVAGPWALPAVASAGATAAGGLSALAPAGLGFTRGGADPPAASLRGAGAGGPIDRDVARPYEDVATKHLESGSPLLAAQALASAARLSRDPAQRRALATRAGEISQALEPSRGKVYLDVHLAKTRVELADASSLGRDTDLLAAHGSLGAAVRMAQQLGVPGAESYALGNLSQLYAAEHRNDEALILTRRALRAAEQADAPGLEYRWHWQEGRQLWEQGRAAAALTSYRRAVGILQELRPEAHAQAGASAARFRRAVAPVYRDYVDALLQSSGTLSDPADTRSLLVEARSATEALKAAELRDYFQDECAAELRGREMDIDRVARATSSAVIYPILLPDRTELLVSLPSGIERYTVPVGADQVGAATRRLRHHLVDRVTRDFEPPARELYQWLIAPYADRLAADQVTTLVFVPDGPLRTIPMAALHDGERFLAERYALAVTPGLSLVDPSPLNAEGARMLLAGLSESVQGFSALPGTRREVQAIHGLYGGKVLLNRDFQAAAFKQDIETEVPSVVHVASHAVFSGDPDTSFVLTHDGRLSVDELSSLVAPTQFRQRPLELLALSACETAAGDERAALGLAGVAIRAGARSALGSLWAVQDDATYQLFLGFYQALKLPGVSKAEALRRSQLQLMQDARFRHPYYWSPFLLISNWL